MSSTPPGAGAFKDFSQGVNTDRPAKRSKIQGWLITLLVLAILVFAGYIGLYLLDRDVLKPFDARSSSVEPVTEQVSEDKEEQ
ncbi:hypothetical protein AGMMS49957_16300 [Synergistales bacterium]|nr:hypothetical protein AGMMS49957_16300 [Synergistales bacterium]